MQNDKQLIADSFSRSALRYDNAARVQQQSGQQLLAMMSQALDDTTIDVIADIGCGTGYFTQSLVEHYQPQHYMGIDISQGMLEVASSNNHSLSNVQWLCEDAEDLQISDQSVNLIYANFSLQWCENLSALMQHFYRVLTPGGCIGFTSLSPNTLYELREAWSKVDQHQHVNRFYDKDDWQQAITQQKLAVVQHQRHTVIDYFASVKSALHSIKDIGANKLRGQQRQSLMGKQDFKRFVQAYEQFRQPQGVPMTYEVDMWIVEKSL